MNSMVAATFSGGFCLSILAWPGALGAATPPPLRPNLVLILADDMGYGDPGCYGGKLAPTPRIDRLAAAGVRFTEGYVTAPLCAPSRCGLLTGAYNERFGMQGNQDHSVQNEYTIPPQHQLLPQALRAAGYVTGHIGKWNVTREVTNCFDETFDVIDWEADYLPDGEGNYVGVDNPNQHNSSHRHNLWGADQPGQEYLTDRMGRHAVEFIQKHKDRPFFLYLAFNAVHAPYQAKKQLREKYGHIGPEPLNFYAAMCASLDENIGRVVDELQRLGLETNTLVAFTSDNGPMLWPTNLIVGSAGPLRGYKSQFYEGGIREPFILRWPGRLKAGAVYAKPVSTMDLYPTLCAAAGTEIPSGTRLDGVNLLPYLAGQKTGPPHAILFWKNGPWGAVRQDHWKLIVAGRPQLFDLAQDIGERRDLAGKNPALAQQLQQAWLQWCAPFPPPATPRAPQQRQ